jgi:hypothetical protein
MSGVLPPERSPVQKWIRTNQGVGVLLTACLLAYLTFLQFSPWVHEELRDGFTLGFFPVTGVVFMLLCTVSLILDRNRNERIRELDEMRWVWFLFSIVVLVGCGAYFYLILEIGYLLVSPFFLFVFVYFLGLRPWSSALIAGAVTAVLVYGLFKLIGIDLPPGILPF